MKKGTSHHVNTLENYGGIQSEMGGERAAVVQLVFRSSYNLLFEIIRSTGDEYFCDNADAHDINRNFLDCMDKYAKLYSGAAGKSYGVRNEIRGSGRAIKQVLPEAPELVSYWIYLTVI